MTRFLKKRSHKAGLAPGSMVMVGEAQQGDIRIRMMDYGGDHLNERELADVDETLPIRSKPTVTWVDCGGIHDLEMLTRIGRRFGIHSLAMEDILNTGHRPKFDEFDDHLFIVLKMLDCDAETGRIRSVQVSLVCGDGYLLSFQESEGGAFEPVRSRIRKGRVRLRTSGASYLAYALMDAVVDRYFAVLESIGDRIDDIEQALVAEPERETLHRIHDLKRELIYFRKQARPVRELVAAMRRSESDLLQDDTRVFLGDLYDHAVQVIDTLESFSDMLSGLTDLYISTMSHRMNEVMKVLTLIATIFIPLTFIAGVYGMNFKHMPELGWRWAYAAVLVVMAVIAGAMLAVFRRRKWL
jgi:magnesium transporter